jgi:pyrimidine-nucleoside phosphorylase
MAEIGRGLGRKMTALLGDMSQPLGLAAGNALEVIEAIEALHGRGPADFRQHCVDVAAEMLLIAGAVASPEEGRAHAAATLDNGTAWVKFSEWIAAQGGDLHYIEDPTRFPAAPWIAPLCAPRSGYVSRADAREVGFTVVDLGGGRARKEDPVDPAVGVVLTERGKLGSEIGAGEPLLWVHARTQAALDAALARLVNAYDFSDAPVAAPPVVHRVIR